MRHAIRKVRFAILLVGPMLGMSPVVAQSGQLSDAQRFEEAGRLMEESFYDQAASVWLQLVTTSPDNSNYNWKLGEAYMKSYNQKSKALPYLQVAAEKRKPGRSASYDPFDPKETNAPPEVEYWLGKAYHLQSEFDKADEHYRNFIAEVGSKNDFRPMAEHGLLETANARQLMADPKPYQITNIGPIINSEYPDFSPVISLDGNALFFTSRRIRPDSSNIGVIDPMAGLPYENIYVSYKDRRGEWQQPEPLNIDPLVGHLASVNVSADGQTLFIYRDDDGDGNLYQSDLVGEQWTEPVRMGSDINSKAWETHGAITADGNTFYFVSDRSGGLGGRDIYRVVRLPDGKWSKAQNLGNVVNTPYSEDAVFIHPDGRTLYFSSTGHNTMGGFDIFTTELQDDGTWTTPVNIGYPLNTVDDDIYFVTSADGRLGYFSSDKIGGYGEKDIYIVDLPEEMGTDGLAVLKGKILPIPGEPLPKDLMLHITDKASGEVTNYRPRQRDGVYVAILAPCKTYHLDYRVNDTTFHSEDIFVECESSYQEINKEVYLTPVSLAGNTEPEMDATAPADILVVPVDPSVPLEERPIVDTTVPAVVPVVPVDPGAPMKEQPAATTPVTKEKTPVKVASNAPFIAEYTQSYAYNAKGIDPDDADWKAFVAKVVDLLRSNNAAGLVIEASASHVPTKAYTSNEKLSQERMEDARQRLLQAVMAAGGESNNLMLEGLSHLVQGPKYTGDFENVEKYGKYQYVRLKVH